MNPDQTFGSLWESYVFKIAIFVIDSVAPSDQTKLINLIHKANQSSPADTGLSGEGRPDTGNLIGSPVAQLARQWGTALKQPLTPRRIRMEEDQVVLHRAFLLNQQQIESTQHCITRLNELIERAKSGVPVTPLQNQLLLHYQSIQGRHTAYLAKLKVAQDRHMSRHKRCTL